ncbi:MAG: glycerate kinase [Methylococcales bacterium]|nr:glycerate kinase [Methylococcales bacterium]MDD5754406.1 glycerate kinase [Methylococcales bacterium]
MNVETLRENAIQIFYAGIAAANPYEAVKKHFVLNENVSKIHIIAFGKAACAMATAAQEIIPATLLGDAIAVTNYENQIALENVEVIGASHPLPDLAGFNAAKRIAQMAKNAKSGELVLVLISGGGSALCPYPVDAITLEEKITTTNLLLACGATIREINCVRKHLSQLKGGNLAKLIAPAKCHALILSDVLGDDLSVIASGTTVPDESTFADAVMILKAKNVWNDAPQSVRLYLEQAILETPKIIENTTHVLVGSNAMSVEAAVKVAQSLGYEVIRYDYPLCGEARDVAEDFVVAAQRALKNRSGRFAFITGGETTVTLRGNGKGGRNQEMALAFAIAAKKYELTGEWTFLSGGTDGIDGVSPAAGGVVDNNTLQHMKNAGVDFIALLENNDSYTALKSSNNLLMTGATGTNVADLQILLIQIETNS